jgi:hypothetical protein
MVMTCKEFADLCDGASKMLAGDVQQAKDVDAPMQYDAKCAPQIIEVLAKVIAAIASSVVCFAVLLAYCSAAQAGSPCDKGQCSIAAAGRSVGIVAGKAASATVKVAALPVRGLKVVASAVRSREHKPLLRVAKGVRLLCHWR